MLSGKQKFRDNLDGLSQMLMRFPPNPWLTIGETSENKTKQKKKLCKIVSNGQNK